MDKNVINDYNALRQVLAEALESYKEYELWQNEQDTLSTIDTASIKEKVASINTKQQLLDDKVNQLKTSMDFVIERLSKLELDAVDNLPITSDDVQYGEHTLKESGMQNES